MKALAPEILTPSLVQNMARPSQKSALEGLLLVANLYPHPHTREILCPEYLIISTYMGLGTSGWTPDT